METVQSGAHRTDVLLMTAKGKRLKEHRGRERGWKEEVHVTACAYVQVGNEECDNMVMYIHV